MGTSAKGDGTLTKDGMGTSIQTSSRFSNRDDTPLESPITVTDTVTPLIPPANAIGVWITASNDVLLVGDNSTLNNSSPAANQGCDAILSGGKAFIGTSRGNNVFLRRETGDVLVYFRWEF